MDLIKKLLFLVLIGILVLAIVKIALSVFMSIIKTLAMIIALFAICTLVLVLYRKFKDV